MRSLNLLFNYLAFPLISRKSPEIPIVVVFDPHRPYHPNRRRFNPLYPLTISDRNSSLHQDCANCAGPTVFRKEGPDFFVIVTQVLVSALQVQYNPRPLVEMTNDVKR